MPAHPTKKTDRLIALAEQLLARRFSKGEVKRVLAMQHEKTTGGDTISPRTLESIISAARANLVTATDKQRDEHRNESYRFYDSVMRDPTAGIREKLKAQLSIDRLLGLQAPQRHLLDGTIDHKGEIAMDLTQLSDDELVSLERLASRVAPVKPSDAHPAAATPRP